MFRWMEGLKYPEDEIHHMEKITESLREYKKYKTKARLIHLSQTDEDRIKLQIERLKEFDRDWSHSYYPEKLKLRPFKERLRKGCYIEYFLSIVFVTHGDRIKVVERLLSSIEEYKNLEWLEFICVDNGSKPSSASFIRNNYNFIITIKNEENEGTSRAYNAGIRHAKGKYVLIINDDTVIPKGMFYKIYDFLKQNDHYDGIALGLKKIITAIRHCV